MYNEAKIKAIKDSKPFRLADIIMFAVSAVIIVAIFWAMYATRIEGAKVEVYIERKLFATYDLTEKEQTIELLDGKMTIKIKDSLVWVEHTDCHTQQCFNDGKKGFVGQSIICADFNVRITIIGDKRSEIDVGVG